MSSPKSSGVAAKIGSRKCARCHGRFDATARSLQNRFASRAEVSLYLDVFSSGDVVVAKEHHFDVSSRLEVSRLQIIVDADTQDLLIQRSIQ